jgi:hypothetical protein
MQIIVLSFGYLAVKSGAHFWEMTDYRSSIGFSPAGRFLISFGLLTLLIPVAWASGVSFAYYRDYHPFSDGRVIVFSGVAVFLFCLYLSISAFVGVWGAFP